MISPCDSGLGGSWCMVQDSPTSPVSIFLFLGLFISRDDAALTRAAAS